ncbi:MAG: glycosyltransferase family 2 protein [Candidatus Woesearchaeota archaeon]|nr:glycosyltransferase family 2 protein [Candidatus Woesearchaeota archaeon]
MKLSIITPIYNEELNIKPLYDSLKSVLSSMRVKYEIIYVDDGSTDDSLKNIKDLRKKDKNVKFIKFRKNFGQTAALNAGLKYATGDYVVTLDADLQNDPKDIPRLIQKLKEGYDLVVGWRYDRKDPFFKKISSLFASFLKTLVLKEQIHDPGCMLKAFTKNAAKDLELYGEMHRYITALLKLKGYKITEIKVRHLPRVHGKTKYGSKRLIKGFLDLLIIKFWMDYSTRPIHFFGGLGILSSLIGLISGVYLVIDKFAFGKPIGNRPLLLFSVLLIILGFLLVIFGFLADIMVKIYYNQKNEESYSIEYKQF